MESIQHDSMLDYVNSEAQADIRARAIHAPLQLAIPINAKKIALLLAAVALSLALLSILGRSIDDAIGGDTVHPWLSNVLWKFNVDYEQSIPTWFSSAILLSSAGLLGIVAMAKRASQDRYTRHWIGLAIIFLYLSLDETAALHETFTILLRNLLQSTGALFFAWVIVAVPLVVIFGLVYLKFLLHLPPRIRNLFVLAGVIYVGGAVVIEAISANQWVVDDGSSFLYAVISTVEESFEMLGIIVFIYALLSYIEGAEVAVDLSGVANAQPVLRVPSISDTISTWKRSLSRPSVIVFFGGLNLILIQWVLVRELTTLLLGTELVILLVSVAYFVGLSIGYRMAGRVPRTWLMPLGMATLILHLTLPIWFRLLVAGLDSVGAYGVTYLILPLLTPFIISAFYSMFLPLFVDNGEGDLPKFYALELIGSAAGVLTLVLLGMFGLQTVYIIYCAGLLLILWLLGLRQIIVEALALITIGWLIILPGASYWSNALWYEKVHDLPPGMTTLFSGYSPYQKVDVLESPEGARYLFLDGLEHFGEMDGTRLNVVAGQIPASLASPDQALVLGAGSMEMTAFIAEHAGHVTTVEIDPMVVDTSLRYFTRVNHMDTLTNRSIVVDDAKHFLANTEMKYDLIGTDLPAAYNLQTATLYSEPFYMLAAQHLSPNGLFVANLTSTFKPDDLVSRRIAAGLLRTFDDVIVVTAESVGWSFAYASDNLPFDTAAIEAALRESGEVNYALYDTPSVRALVGDAQPITLDSMDIVLQTSADWIADRLSWR